MVPYTARDLSWEDAEAVFQEGNFGKALASYIAPSELIIIITFAAEPDLREIAIFKKSETTYPMFMSAIPCRQIDVDLFFRLNHYANSSVVYRELYMTREEILHLAVMENLDQ